MEVKYIIAIISIISLAAMDIVALSIGIDGTLMISMASIISGIVGGLFGFEIGLKKSS